MSACVSSSLYSVSALTLLTAGALSSVREIGCMKVFGAPSTRLQLLSPINSVNPMEAGLIWRRPRASQMRPRAQVRGLGSEPFWDYFIESYI